MKEKILTELFLNPDLNNTLRKYVSFHDDLLKELKQELFMILSEIEEEKIISLNKDNILIPYSLKIAKNLTVSEYKFFNRKIKAPFFNKAENIVVTKDGKAIDVIDNIREPEDEKGISELRLLILDDAVNQLHFFDRAIIKSYLKLGTIKAAAEENKVDYNYALQSMKRSKIMLSELITKKLKMREEINFKQTNYV